MRTFETGATRGSDKGKIDPEAALSPLVLTAYCEFIRKHRLQGSQEAREDDNWQLGIPPTSYMKSLLRHVLEAWRVHRYGGAMNDILFAVMFNTMGLLHERLKSDQTRQTNQLSGPHRKPLFLKTSSASSPQPVVYPDDWPTEER